MSNNIFTDGERETRWGIEQTSIEQLENAGIPYCFNPENKKAIVLYDGRRRISSVINAFKNNPIPTIIRSKAALIPFLNPGIVYPLQFGFGLTLARIVAEEAHSVQIARIIYEFKFEDLRDLNAYILKERPELFDELTRRHVYYIKIINNFKSNDPLLKINETFKNGFSILAQFTQNKNDK